MPLDLLQADKVANPIMSPIHGFGNGGSSRNQNLGYIGAPEDVFYSGVDFPGNQHAPLDNTSDMVSNEVPQSTEDENRDLSEIVGIDQDHTVSGYYAQHPDATPEEIMRYMAQYSDEWAEKLVDYYTQKQSINEANAYTSSREDTAYQRLVADLRAAGLNPAMMYGNSASISASGSAGLVNLGDSSTSRGVNSLYKIKSLLIASVLAQWQIQHEKTNDVFKGIDEIIKAAIPILALFG